MMKKLALAFVLAGLAVSGSGCVLVPVDEGDSGGEFHHHDGGARVSPRPAPRGDSRPAPVQRRH